MTDRSADRPPPFLHLFLSRVAVTSRKRWAEMLRADQVRRWGNKERVPVETYLQHLPALAQVPDALIDLIYGEFLLREEAGERPQPDEYVQRFPDHAEALRRQFAVHALFAREGGSSPLVSVPGTAQPGARPEIPGYDVLDELGRGGCGVVYRARQKGAGRIVALKMIDGPLGPNAGTRFRLEAEAIGRLQHPHIVQIYEVGEHRGRPFFSLEFVNGGSLADRLDGTPLPADAAAALVETLARAVHSAHQSGIIHRDLKPGNVLLQHPDAAVPDGRTADLGALSPKITDFGLAKFVEEEAARAGPRPTRVNEVLGTPAYMSPEQAQCRNGSIGPATDVHALGAILYELLTGRPPFVGASVLDVIAQVAFEEPGAPGELRPGLPRDLEMVCLKCLQKDPARRYPTAAALAEDLRAFRDGRPVSARPVGVPERALKWSRRRPRTAALIVAALALAATGFATVTALWQNARHALAGEREARLRADDEQRHAHQSEAEARQANAAAERARAESERARAEAEQARGVAEEHRNRAEAALRSAETNLYFGQFALADRAWHAGQLAQAEERLNLCPPAQRAWEWHYLMRQCHRHLATFGAPGGKPAAALAARPDGTLFATLAAGGKGPLTLWDVRTGRAVATLDAQDCAAFSPDGKMIAAGGADNTVRVWDLDDNRPKGPRTLRGHGAAVAGLAFAPNGSRLASAGADGEVRVWDPRATAKAVATVVHNTRRKVRVPAVAFTPDGGHLITGGDDHHLHVWEIGPKPLRTFTLEHASGIRCVAVARHDKHWELLTGTSDGRLRLWRVPNNMVPHDERPQVDVRGHAGAVQAVAFDGAGGRFGSAGQDERIKVWNETGRELATLRGLNGLAFLRDGKTLLAPQADGTVAAWDSSLRSPLGLRDLPRPLTHLTFSPDAKLLAALSDERKVALWEAGSLTPVPVPTAVGEVFAVGFGGDGQCLVARGGPGGGLLLSRATKPDPSVALVGWTGTPVAGAFSPDGRRLALVGPDRAVSVWDTADGHRIWAADTTEAAPVRVALSRDGSRLVVLTEREIVARGAAGEVLCAHERPAGSGPPAISPDGLRVATASKDGVVRVWDVDRPDDDGLTLAGRDGSALGLAFTPDGRRVATADKDGAVRIWDTRSEQELVELAARPTEVLALAFAPDGRLAASGKDKSLQVWDGRPLP